MGELSGLKDKQARREQHALKTTIKRFAQRSDLNPRLVLAVCVVESSLDTWATRFEPGWRWFLNPKQWARTHRRSEATERVHQATSWGLMQVMGTVAMEMGYQGPLPALCLPERGLYYGCKKLKSLVEKYGDLQKALSAYNTGRPDTKAGKLYAGKVFDEMEKIPVDWGKKEEGSCFYQKPPSPQKEDKRLPT
jgi:hypothetical protein